VSALAFELPARLVASEPPEARGLARDEVKLLVATRSDGAIRDARFRELPKLLAPGDLLVVNVSATIPAAVPATRSDGNSVQVHFSTQVPRLDDTWRVAELRGANGERPARGRPGEVIGLRGGAMIELVAPYASGPRLMLTRYDGPVPLLEYLKGYGEPIRYTHSARRWSLAAYQNVYATTPGSSEMASAGRPLTGQLIARLGAAGVLLAPITLHAGVSSLERHESPFPEQFRVPETTAALIAAVHGWGGRVVAVGTTVVRALETVARADGTIEPGSGWTNLVITPDRGLRVVDGVITGWHEPEASHLALLEAAAGGDLLRRSYESALSNGYLWHEFGDSHLVLP
jgi:S-adenosylmethionine:tRNA ribosyltransferase-isomerase